MLVEVTRPYGGAEGKRVKPGTRFWVDQPGRAKKPEGLRTITRARFMQLKSMKLVSEVNAESAAKPAKAAAPDRTPRAKPAPDPKAKVEPDSRPPAPPPPGPRQAAKAKAPAPKAKAEARPAGTPTGQDAPSSSSLAGRPTKPSTLKQRGVRRKGSEPAGSPSTTPSDSSPGQTSSTPATPGGGGTTTESGDLTAFG